MYWHSKVVWAEGMLLEQQHLQQHDRYLQRFIEARWGTQLHYGWGFSRLVLDERQLALGCVALTECEGVMPDGTPFSAPADDTLPLPLPVPVSARDATVVLALPLARPGVPETASAEDEQGARYARYLCEQHDVADSNAWGDAVAPTTLGRLRFTLALADEVRQGYAVLGVVRVSERLADNRLMLDTRYVPPCIDYRAAAPLRAFVSELAALLHQRGEMLAARLAQPGITGVAEISDFLMLQLVDSAQPLFKHFARRTGLHPEALYGELLRLAGGLATLTRRERRGGDLPRYLHDDLAATFAPVIDDVRWSLSVVKEPQAIAILLEDGELGMRVGRVADRSLFERADFVLAVRADVAADTLWAQLRSQLKIGPVELIQELVNLQLPGIAFRPLPAAPRQLPLHAGCSYLSLDAGDALWPRLSESAGIALHLAGALPGLDLQLWAIRR